MQHILPIKEKKEIIEYCLQKNKEVFIAMDSKTIKIKNSKPYVCNDLSVGKVLFYLPNKGYGFLVVQEGQEARESLYFHITGFRNIKIEQEEFFLSSITSTREQLDEVAEEIKTAGTVVLYHKGHHIEKGHYADEWTLMDDFEAAKEQLANIPVYRLIRIIEKITDDTYNQTEVWRGSNLLELQLFLRSNPLSDMDYPQFQQNVNGNWEDCENPLELLETI
jgi:hypothetical protein